MFVVELVLRSTENWPFPSIVDTLKSTEADLAADEQGIADALEAERLGLSDNGALEDEGEDAQFIRDALEGERLEAMERNRVKAQPTPMQYAELRDFVRSQRGKAPVIEVIEVIEIIETPVIETVVEMVATPVLVAEGTEELQGTTHDQMAPCLLCDTNAGPMRVDGLCSPCFDERCESDALEYTGVSLKTRRVEIRLNAKGIEMSPEYTASKDDPSTLVWLTSAWFRNHDGVEHPREWSLLDNGDVVGSVVYDHKRRVYRASALGGFLRTERNEGFAKRLVSDVVNDARNAVQAEAAEDSAVAKMVATLGGLFASQQTAAKQG
jgi:hypothetical protein